MQALEIVLETGERAWHSVGVVGADAGRQLTRDRVERVVDGIERAVPIPAIEVIVKRRTRRHVLRDGAPLAASVEDIHQAVHDSGSWPSRRLPPGLAGGMSGSTCHSASVKSLG